jgi:hypothetical protein
VRRALRLIGVVLASSGLAASVGAAEPTRPAREVCVASVFKLCPAAAMAGDRKAAEDCLLKNLRKATLECQLAVKAETKAASSDPPGGRRD